MSYEVIRLKDENMPSFQTIWTYLPHTHMGTYLGRWVDVYDLHLMVRPRKPGLGRKVLIQVHLRVAILTILEAPGTFLYGLNIFEMEYSEFKFQHIKRRVRV